MTTDLDFRQLIDGDPTNWQHYLVYSDFLQERGDVRGLGFAALGNNRLVPYLFGNSLGGTKVWGFWDSDYRWMRNSLGVDNLSRTNCLPYRWIQLVEEQKHLKSNFGRNIYHEDKRGSSAFVLCRAVALAFSKLPSQYQQEILNGNLDG